MSRKAQRIDGALYRFTCLDCGDVRVGIVNSPGFDGPDCQACGKPPANPSPDIAAWYDGLPDLK